MMNKGYYGLPSERDEHSPRRCLAHCMS